MGLEGVSLKTKIVTNRIKMMTVIVMMMVMLSRRIIELCDVSQLSSRLVSVPGGGDDGGDDDDIHSFQPKPLESLCWCLFCL